VKAQVHRPAWSFRLAPGGLVVPVSLTFDLEPPFDGQRASYSFIVSI
jgi:hypothetical protein